MIESQKRVLHIMLTLRNQGKPTGYNRIDQLISVEIPNPEQNAILFQLLGYDTRPMR